MNNAVHRINAIVLGEQSLLIQCCELLHARGHRIVAVVTGNARILGWCNDHGIPTCPKISDLQEHPAAIDFEYLFSITNLKMVPDWLLRRPSQMAINFHDGPLPAYAGLNAPVWALLNGETEYGITWHQMGAGADTGPILVNRQFPLEADDTAFSLNIRCYEAGLDAFSALLTDIESGHLQPREQDLQRRTYYGRNRRPRAAALLDWNESAKDLLRVVRALDFGSYHNPLVLPRIDLGVRFLLARQAELASGASDALPGTILASDETSITVRCRDAALRITRLTDLRGEPVTVNACLQAAGMQVGSRLPDKLRGNPPAIDAEILSEWVGSHCHHEATWTGQLRCVESPELPSMGKREEGAAETWRYLAGEAGDINSAAVTARVALFALGLARLTGRYQFTLAVVPHSLQTLPDWMMRFVSPVVPLNLQIDGLQSFAELNGAVAERLARVEAQCSYLNDLVAREPDLKGSGDCTELPVRMILCDTVAAEQARRFADGAALTVLIGGNGELGALADGTRVTATVLDRLMSCVKVLGAAVRHRPDAPMRYLPVLDEEDAKKLVGLNAHADCAIPDHMAGATLTTLFERQAAATPDRTALIVAGRHLSYAELNAAANRLARYLCEIGTRPGDLVGVMVERSRDMLVALYAVHKAGAAYVPLDPVYPEDRLAFMIEDAGLRTVITQRALVDRAGKSTPVILDELDDRLSQNEGSNPEIAYPDSSLAYVIYTSGSTGKPKGVMVEHRQVVNFFAGMDQQLEPGPGKWLAVTSISFDISVLELFWTLARGFTIVLYADQLRPASADRTSQVSHGVHFSASTPGMPAPMTRKLEFGFFYWNVADDTSENDSDKYRLLLDGARFADQHGFNAVWNPERHFASFGGLFPNPSVTTAALATITHNVALRAGSCVAPLHSPIRIAEEWSVVDNLSGGRVGIAIAAGWAPPDFVIRPESFANAKQVMFETADIVQRLWRGERVPFPGPNGDVMVRTLPRPIQPELPIWVTTAGNLESFVQAGTKGMNLLTHLLGQTIEEVATKVQAYREAWTRAGHGGRGIVTVMLHTFVGPDPDAIERAVRGPLKAYLKSAMFLVKSAAWQFPTFKKMSDEQGRTLDEFFDSISEQDLDDLLEFAFERYFETSGLFGTPEHCMAMVDKVNGADIDEIACLIDFGIDTDIVLTHLPYLNELRKKAQSATTRQVAPPRLAATAADYSLAGLLANHQITHFQCTPSMATMLVNDEHSQPGLAALKQLMVGGEAFPPELARTLRRLVGGRITNMYGPTESTIWSTVGDVEDSGSNRSNNVSIGRALPRQRAYILDEFQQLMPPGFAGELVIGGAGVARGYWQRPDLTAERFLPDPFVDTPGATTDGESTHRGRMYRTGDLARFLDDGRLECLGRVDHQVKIRGYRVELGEIETLLREQDGVREAAVVLREYSPGDQRLVAYLVGTGGRAVAPGVLQASLRGQLPEFMVPSEFVQLPALPLTPNGKIDRKSLPAPQQRELPSQSFAPPGNEAEAMISEIWQRALGVAQVGTRDNFFDIGGHSLLVVQVLKELREKTAKPIQMTDLFKHTTIESLARFLGSDGGTTPGPDRGKSRADARRAAMSRRRS